jgi:hypothetical protein
MLIRTAIEKLKLGYMIISIAATPFLSYPQCHGGGCPGTGFRANQKSAGKGGRIMEGAPPELISGLPPGFQNHTRSGWIGLKLRHISYPMLCTRFPLSEFQNS